MSEILLDGMIAAAMIAVLLLITWLSLPSVLLFVAQIVSSVACSVFVLRLMDVL
jgi:hypothetical protein